MIDKQIHAAVVMTGYWCSACLWSAVQGTTQAADRAVYLGELTAVTWCVCGLMAAWVAVTELRCEGESDV